MVPMKFAALILRIFHGIYLDGGRRNSSKLKGYRIKAEGKELKAESSKLKGEKRTEV